MAITMALTFDDADPVATCECGWHAHGDAINDAVLAWTRHVTNTPECRDRIDQDTEPEPLRVTMTEDERYENIFARLVRSGLIEIVPPRDFS